MSEVKNHYSFLVVGKAQESTEGSEGFKKYCGLGGSFVLAVNPNKAKTDELLGYETQSDPEYLQEDDQGKKAIVTFIVRTDPETNNGIEITHRAQITLRPTPAYNRNGDKVQVIDQYGNFTWADKETAEAGGTIENAQKLDKYRLACVGECALVDFLKKYLNVPDAYDYKEGVWTKKAEKDAKEGLFGLEHISDYFKGDFSEINEAIALQPHNKIKLLYGVRTNDEGKQYQAVCTYENLMLNNAAGSKGIANLEKNLQKLKASGSMSNVDYRVQVLQEYDVKPTNLDAAPAATEAPAGGAAQQKMPWD